VDGKEMGERIEAARLRLERINQKYVTDGVLEKAKNFLRENKIQRKTPPQKSKDEIVIDINGNVLKNGPWVRPGCRPGEKWYC